MKNIHILDFEKHNECIGLPYVAEWFLNSETYLFKI